MGLLDSLTNTAMSALSGQLSGGGAGDEAAGAAAAAHPGMLDVITGLLSGASGAADGGAPGASAAGGGLAGLLASCQQLGLGEIVSSWIGKGQNLPISADQVQALLGSEQVQAIAQKLGLSAPDAAQALSTALPTVVDRVTPDGELPSSDLLEQGLALFRSLSAGR